MPIWTSEEARAHALSVGFDVCHVTSVEEGWAASDRLRSFVEAGFHGDMQWMEDTLERRVHPQAMWSGAKSAIVVGVNYGPDHNPLGILEQTDRAAISVYAKGKDYHDLLKKRLKQLARDFVAATGCEVKVFVDTAPLMEKPLAAKSGLGWQGKHTNLVSREFGSWLFLGVMLTEAELSPDEPGEDKCGSCRACLDICPTNAFPGPYQLDARKCISYLTIEHDGPIPLDLREPMGNRIYGCDDCLAVCPWNKFAQLSSEAKFAAGVMTDAPALSELLALDDEAFREAYRGSPIKRIKRRRFLRNVLIATGNSGDTSLIPTVKNLLSDEEPLVRGMAVWALSRLDLAGARAAKAEHLASEADAQVQSEWHLIN
ncbi:tRNA epoxyqueuosine(34) reductase QueG [Ponticaulis sp.]|uniref:tRNA epoxyqueuosine(34) reductase QueG n=1 Tax=Ponticaulis sp. TaxID=2020902 RepID=UPI000B667E43|nr:tRNA epoxyqueuosine(34) reductase QueG [Ponticaulis sp.]MAI90165.1 tRNA epoxyqueuosine(34) reductase QueG [Ponticaulis sp.]OUX99816.1 MAG: tRNA epoxyqueuosine(34) reductase QueG [Hyphomonadaceae bacterium TMED5]|tara:strand:+ start:124118 stop:125233 length:1116 start_codon:yes stop_codon:yes gene_type:complete